MIHTLQYLHDEHADVRSLLIRLRSQVATLTATEPDSMEPVWDGMQGLGHYLRWIHHPMEQALLDKLLDRLGHGQHLIKPFVTQDWRFFGLHSTEFLTALDAVRQGAVVPREALLERGQAVLADLSREIRIEEAAVFPLAEQLLTEDDWIEVEARRQVLRDWTLGRVLETEYRTLQAQLASPGGDIRREH